MAGKLNGVIPATTPSGWNSLHESISGPTFLKTPLLKALVRRKHIQRFQYRVAIRLEHHEKFCRALAQSKRGILL